MIPSCVIEFVSILSDVFVGLSALAVAIIGFIGLTKWRAELKGRAKYEIARKMAMLAFKYRDEYKRARNPFTFSTESADRIKDDAETYEESHILDEYYARSHRLITLQDTLRKLYEANWEAEVILDKEIGKFIEPLENAFKDLFSSIEVFFHSQITQSKRKRTQGNGPLEPHHRIIYGLDGDELSQAIDKSTEAFVEKLKEYMK